MPLAPNAFLDVTGRRDPMKSAKKVFRENSTIGTVQDGKNQPKISID